MELRFDKVYEDFDTLNEILRKGKLIYKTDKFRVLEREENGVLSYWLVEINVYEYEGQIVLVVFYDEIIAESPDNWGFGTQAFAIIRLL